MQDGGLKICEKKIEPWNVKKQKKFSTDTLREKKLPPNYYTRQWPMP